jgi:hypothetical protein
MVCSISDTAAACRHGPGNSSVKSSASGGVSRSFAGEKSTSGLAQSKRFASLRSLLQRASVVECGSPLPLLAGPCHKPKIRNGNRETGEIHELAMASEEGSLHLRGEALGSLGTVFRPLVFAWFASFAVISNCGVWDKLSAPENWP